MLIDEIAVTNLERAFISIAKTANPQDGFEDIKYSTLAKAVNRASWWIQNNIGQGSYFPTLFAYLEPHDLRHAILILAAIKTGYKVCRSSFTEIVYMLRSLNPDVLQFTEQ